MLREWLYNKLIDKVSEEKKKVIELQWQKAELERLLEQRKKES